MALWAIDGISIAGGFLSDVSVRLPEGLICIIGPRGSGKSTLAEAIRITLGGIPPGAAKSRADLIKANLGAAGVTLTTKSGTDRGGFTVRRTYGQTAIITGPDSKAITTIDLDHGTFLPLDAYSNVDIEGIADETLGSKRRSLLDDLRASEMHEIHLALSGHARSLEANAESIRAITRAISELAEQVEELGDVDAKLAALPPSSDHPGTPAFQEASKQKQLNERESVRLSAVVQRVKRFDAELETLVADLKRDSKEQLSIAESRNETLLRQADETLRNMWMALDESARMMRGTVSRALAGLEQISSALRTSHAGQDATYLSLQHENQEATKAFEARAIAERDAAALLALKHQVTDAAEKLGRLQEERKNVKAAFILTRDRVSELREKVAASLQAQAGSKVRIRVKRNADVLEYQQRVLSALYGSKLKNQEEILRTLCAVRPEDLAVILRENDIAEFETHTSFGKERGRRILDLLRQNLDSLELEVLPIDDQVIIELNVATDSVPHFKDASELSRGQKCTALLPIILARRDTPLVIDQPEDNLDNHFIYETVVDSIRRLKTRRQMIFITHNANIPVLGEAELVIVMNSDGRRGYVEKTGTVDECRNEIIDLLEGGEEAFELRRKRYGAR